MTMTPVILQCDRIAACKHLGWDDEDDLRYWGSLGDQAKVNELAQSFARCRQAEAARIVEWLRELGEGSIQHTIRNACADAIEANAHHEEKPE